VSRSRTIAESAKIHPAKPIIALKAHNVLQVYNFDTKNMLNEVELLHEVVFWKWVNEETIMMVTEKSAHYWAVFRDRSELEFICPRLPRLKSTEIVNCAVDEHYRWFTITGLLDHGKESLIEGVTQVYSAVHGVSQCIEAHTTTFVTHKFTGNIHESVVLCAASRLLESLNGRVHTIEFASAVLGSSLTRFSTSDLKFSTSTTRPHKASDGIKMSDKQNMDFPVCLQADASHGVLYIVTKYGRLYLAEMESATVLAQIQICFSISFCSALDSLSYLTVISKASQVLRISIDWLLLIKHVRNVLNRPDLATRLQNCRGMENVDLLHSLNIGD